MAKTTGETIGDTGDIGQIGETIGGLLAGDIGQIGETIGDTRSVRLLAIDYQPPPWPPLSLGVHSSRFYQQIYQHSQIYQ